MTADAEKIIMALIYIDTSLMKHQEGEDQIDEVLKLMHKDSIVYHNSDCGQI